MNDIKDSKLDYVYTNKYITEYKNFKVKYWFAIYMFLLFASEGKRNFTISTDMILRQFNYKIKTSYVIKIFKLLKDDKLILFDYNSSSGFASINFIEENPTFKTTN